MALSAADLQKRHELEGAPDPFPTLETSASGKQANGKANGGQSLDTDSETAFPTLSSSTAVSAAPQASAWSSAAGPRLKPSVPKTPIFTDTFTLTAIDLSTSGKDGKPTTLGDVIRQVTAKYKVKVEASTNQRARQTTFHVKAESQKELDKAKRSLLALLSPTVTSVLNAPASTIGSIIGPKGATLKQIRDQTSVRVDIPPRDSAQPSAVATPAGSGKATPLPPTGDDEDEPLIPITLTGPQPLVLEARELLNQIIASKTSISTQRAKDIPVHILPFIATRKNHIVSSASDGVDVNSSINWTAREVIVTGDRPTVGKVVEAIKQAVEDLEGNLTSLKISLPKRQHRLLVGKAVEEIMIKSECSVVIADQDDPSEEVTVWGPGLKLSQGLQAVMEKANSQHVTSFPLPTGDSAKQICTYLARTGFVKTLTSTFPGVSVFLPSPTVVENAVQDKKKVNVDLIGEQEKVKTVLSKLKEIVEKLSGGATRELEIDWLVHRIVKGKGAKKIKALHEQQNVQIFFPPESSESRSVLLVYDPTTSATANKEEKKKNLDEAEKELRKLASEAADVKTRKVEVEEKWHDAIVGQNGTTLNAIIGEDKTLSVKVGAEAGEPSRDVVVIRGTAADVDKAVKEILQIVEKAKNDEIVNSYSTEFEIDREYVGRIVGAQGAGVNKLRDQLGVRIDVSDEGDDGHKESSSGKKKKSSSGHHLKSRVKITGREENVEEAKRRVLTQVERLADETQETLKIPSQYHASLIGQSGKYAIRLEEKYGVKITFPRQSAEGHTRENLKPDEVLIKGGKKGVAGAKAELLDAAEFEKETNNVLKFTVPQRAVARILGKGGVQINEIKDTTDAQIDIDRPEDNKDGNADVNITLRGTKKAINAAKTAILAIADQVHEEVTVVVEVENRFHRTIIGGGGQGLKDLVAKVGGPTDPKVQAGLIRFPRQGEPSDEVKLRGEPKLVNKLKVELEKIVSELRDRVVLAVEIPQAQHRALIGRGGQHLNELQDKRHVQVQFPGSRSYNQVGEPENKADFEDVEPTNIVKVTGSRQACEETIQELKGKIKPAAPEGVSGTVTVPFKYHHAVTQQGALFRTLRSFGVNVDLPQQPPKLELPSRPAPEGAATARIDEPESVDENAISWEVVANYQGAQDGESTWTLNARDAAGLERATKHIQGAIEHAERMSQVGFLTLPDRAIFPRIVGAKGANVARLRAETGADIQVGRDNNTIVIIGSEHDILVAKDAILNMANNPGRNGRH